MSSIQGLKFIDGIKDLIVKILKSKRVSASKLSDFILTFYLLLGVFNYLCQIRYTYYVRDNMDKTDLYLNNISFCMFSS